MSYIEFMMSIASRRTNDTKINNEERSGSMTNLQGKVALVTGGSRGAGRGIALELAKAGAYVYITGRSTGLSQEGRRKGTIDSVLDEIKAVGGAG